MNDATLVAILIVGVAACLILGYAAYADFTERKKNGILLQAAAEQFEANRGDREFGIRFLQALTGLKFLRGDVRFALETSFSVVQAHLGDSRVSECFFKYLTNVEWVGVDRASGYQGVLKLLTLNSEPNIKQLVLHVARWHYAFDRPDRKPTIYDEQAISNDISAYLPSPTAV